jgi:hypothetical protein
MITARKTITLLAGVGVVMIMLALPALAASSDGQNGQPAIQRMNSSNGSAAGSSGKETPTPSGDNSKISTHEGTIMDLRSYVTGAKRDGDFAKTAAAELKAGSPAVLETSKGVFLLAPEKGRALEPLSTFGGRFVRIEGKLWERGGLKYMEFSNIATESKPQVGAHGQSKSSMSKVPVNPPHASKGIAVPGTYHK